MLRTAPTWLKALLLGQLVSAAGSLAWLYLTLYLVHTRGLSPAAGGVVTGLYGLGAIGGNLVGDSLGDRFGLRTALGVAKGAAVLTCIAFPVCPRVGLAPLALLAGLASGTSRPLMSAVVATGLPTALRREGIALSRAAFNAGAVIGPPLGGLLAAHHFGWVFLIDGATSAVLLVTVLRFVPTGQPVVRGPRRGLVSILRADHQMRTLVLTVLAVDTTYRLLYTALPLFLTDHRAPAWLYGLTISINGLMIVALEPRVARRLTARPALPVIAAGYAVVGLGWLLLGAAPSVLIAFVTVLVISVGEMLYKPTATAHAADLAPAGMEARYQSLYAAASIGGMLLSPLLGTTLYSAAPWAVWPSAGLLALAAAVCLAPSSSSSSPRASRSASALPGSDPSA